MWTRRGWMCFAVLPCALLACGGQSKDHSGSGATTGAGAASGAGGSGGGSGQGAGGSNAGNGSSGARAGGTTGSSGQATGGSGGVSGRATGESSGVSGSGSGQGGATGGTSGAGQGGSSVAGRGAASGAGGESAGIGGGGAGGLACPQTAPKDGDLCSIENTSGAYPRGDCTFGDDPRPNCRVAAACVNGAWRLTQPNPAECTAPPLPSACPATPATMGDTCSDSSLECWYDDGTHCACSPCMNGSAYPLCQQIDPPEWACGKPPTGCPNPLPKAGQPCNDAKLQCGPSCELPIRCENGVWVYDEISCLICASPDTPIATPEGERAIAELHPGDLVYSVNGDAVVVVPVARVGSTPVVNHRVVRAELDDGSVLELSAGHPTADGRHFSDLAPGVLLDERHVVVRAELVPYRYQRTFDILPASSTGTYFAAGALVGSTLRGPGLQVQQ